jgi:hypothetical protein
MGRASTRRGSVTSSVGRIGTGKIQRPGPNSPGGPRVERSCEVCKEPFWPRSVDVAAGKGRHCSSNCSSKAFRRTPVCRCGKRTSSYTATVCGDCRRAAVAAEREAAQAAKVANAPTSRWQRIQSGELRMVTLSELGRITGRNRLHAADVRSRLVLARAAVGVWRWCRSSGADEASRALTSRRVSVSSEYASRPSLCGRALAAAAAGCLPIVGDSLLASALCALRRQSNWCVSDVAVRSAPLRRATTAAASAKLLRLPSPANRIRRNMWRSYWASARLRSAVG